MKPAPTQDSPHEKKKEAPKGSPGSRLPTPRELALLGQDGKPVPKEPPYADKQFPLYPDDTLPMSPDQEALPGYDYGSPPAGYPGYPGYPLPGTHQHQSPEERLPAYDLATPPAGYPGGPQYRGPVGYPSHPHAGQPMSPGERLPEYSLGTPPAGYPGGPVFSGDRSPHDRTPVKSPSEQLPMYDIVTPPAGYPGGPGYHEPSPTQFLWPPGAGPTHQEPLKDEPFAPKRYPNSPDPFSERPARRSPRRKSPHSHSPPVTPEMRYKPRPQYRTPIYPQYHDNPLFPGGALPDEIPPRYLSGPPEGTKSEPDLLDDSIGPSIWKCGSKCFSFPHNLDDVGLDGGHPGHTHTFHSHPTGSSGPPSLEPSRERGRPHTLPRTAAATEMPTTQSQLSGNRKSGTKDTEV